ncbi:MAG TPA: hypothetical protein VFQ90_10400 [Stellaceae bacterium]|jgi:hypothetical protein|nr:hypothetical protein [Stellaceae bacterium]
MDLKDAVAAAKQHMCDLFAPETLQNIRLEEFLYDDHLMVWSLTIGFALPQRGNDSSPLARACKIVRVSEADKAVLSVRDR